MKNLGDQWIELIDGVEHMVKAVEKVSEKSYDCTGCIFNGHNGTCRYHSQDCPLGEVEHGYIKDLGILKNGLLQCYRCGGYPDIIGEDKDGLKAFFHLCKGDGEWMVKMESRYYATEQLAKDAWNRRA